MTNDESNPNDRRFETLRFSHSSIRTLIRHSSFVLRHSLLVVRHSCSGADGLAAALAGADSDAVFEWDDEDFAVADLAGVAGARAVNDRFDRGFGEGIVDGDFEFQFGEQ